MRENGVEKKMFEHRIEELNEKNWDIILNKLIDKFDNTYVLIKKFY